MFKTKDMGKTKKNVPDLKLRTARPHQPQHMGGKIFRIPSMRHARSSGRCPGQTWKNAFLFKTKTYFHPKNILPKKVCKLQQI